MHPQAGRITVDLSKVCANYDALMARLDSRVTLSAVVKADSYGLGAAPIAKMLHAHGCRHFTVANVAEGQKLRTAFGQDANILVLQGFRAAESDYYSAHHLTPVVTDLSSLDDYMQAQQKASLHGFTLHVNTGMNRMGLSADEVTILQNQSREWAQHCAAVMSHLSCADEANHPMNAQQKLDFDAVCQQLDVMHLPRSFANSSGIFLGTDYHYDMVRPGMALYGLNPAPYLSDCPTELAVRVQVPVIAKRTVKSGDSVGYGASYTADGDKKVVTLGAGYADGIFRSLSNKGAFYHQGQRCPIIGRVSMDMACADISVLEADIQIGDMFDYIGADQDPADIARAAGSLDYEVISVLGQRFVRDYI